MINLLSQNICELDYLAALPAQVLLHLYPGILNKVLHYQEVIHIPICSMVLIPYSRRSG